MRLSSSVIAAITVSLLASAEAFASPPALSLRVGERRVLPMSSAVGVLLERAELADVRLLDGSFIQVIGRRSGRARLDVWDDRGRRTSYTLRVLARRSREARP